MGADPADCDDTTVRRLVPVRQVFREDDRNLTLPMMLDQHPGHQRKVRKDLEPNTFISQISYLLMVSRYWMEPRYATMVNSGIESAALVYQKGMDQDPARAAPEIWLAKHCLSVDHTTGSLRLCLKTQVCLLVLVEPQVLMATEQVKVRFITQHPPAECEPNSTIYLGNQLSGRDSLSFKPLLISALRLSKPILDHQQLRM